MKRRHYKKYLLSRGMFVMRCIYQLTIFLFLLGLSVTQKPYLLSKCLRHPRCLKHVLLYLLILPGISLGPFRVLLDAFLLVQIFFRSVNIYVEATNNVVTSWNTISAVPGTSEILFSIVLAVLLDSKRLSGILKPLLKHHFLQKEMGARGRHQRLQSFRFVQDILWVVPISVA